jgi:hypothetical protein
VVKERVGGGRGAEFVAFDCISQEKAAHGHVVYTVQEAPFWAPFDAVFDTSCPGNERCAVELQRREVPSLSSLVAELGVAFGGELRSQELPSAKPRACSICYLT